MEILNQVCKYLAFIFGVFIVYKTLYIVIGFFCKKKVYPETKEKMKYAVVIPARNEEKVLPKLIESIRNQTYDSSMITIFVMADNCQDQTATIAREMGCIVYERHEPEKNRKGYGLQFLFQHIEKDYKISSFDGYMMFDADNILKEDFVEQINRAFVINKNIVMGYRNTKNFDTNIISSSYGLHFCFCNLAYHRPRGILNLGTHLAGTGFVISSHLLKDGWNYLSLTEDAELTIALNDKDIKVEYCEDAEFYDEQPTNFSVAFRQRVRWSKGRLVCFFRGFKSLFTNIFKHKSFTSYDLLWYYFPYSLLSTIISITYPFVSLIISISTGSFDGMALLKAIGIFFGTQYVSNVLTGALTLIREANHIHCGFFKTIFYLLCWPWFNITGIVFIVVALCKKEVLWTPIVHKDVRGLDEIKSKKFIKDKTEK